MYTGTKKGYRKEKNPNKIYLWGDGKEKKSSYIRGRAEITISLIRNNTMDGNMVSGRSYSYRSIAENIQEKTNCVIVERERTGSAVNHSYINKKLEEMIGYYEFRQPLANK